MLVLYEQLQNDPKININQDVESNNSEETNTTSSNLTENPEFMPLKKYYLINKIDDLKSKLKMYGINNIFLDMVYPFFNSLSYATLLLVSDKILLDLERMLEEEITKNKKEKIKNV